jgi:hypothetical protein
MENYYFVNWVDGMKLNRTHFEAEENALINRMRKSLSTLTQSFSYGLLPPRGGDGPLRMKLEIDRAQLLRIQVSECHAVTPGGVVIDIKPQYQHDQMKEVGGMLSEVSLASLNNGRSYYVALTVHPFRKRPVGEQDPNDAPPRLPFSDYYYDITLVSADDPGLFENGLFHLAISKFTVRTNGIEIDEHYIPPCTSCLSHPDLAEVARDLGSVLTKMETRCVGIISSIFEKNQTAELPATVLYLLEKILAFLSVNIPLYRNQAAESSPLFLLNLVSGLARVVKNAIDSKGRAGKEEMLNYFRSWIVDVSQGEFEEIVDHMVNLEYRHSDINLSLKSILSFCNTLTTILKKLDELEFIGDKKLKQGPVIDVRKKVDVDVQPQKPVKRSFLAE